MFQIPALSFWGFMEVFLLHEYIWLLVLEFKMSRVTQTTVT